MGGDGGSIPKREDIVKKKEKIEQKDKQAENVAHYKHCQLSHQPLRSPIVACQLGRLYNKDAVIQYLLTPKAERSKASSEFMQHIRTLRDVTVLPHANAVTNNVTTQGENTETSGDWLFACPLTTADLNGTQPFCFLRKCGCVFSRRGFNNVVASDSSTENASVCPQCGETIVSVVDLYPPADAQAKILANLVATKEKQSSTSAKRKLSSGGGNNMDESLKHASSMDKAKIASTDYAGSRADQTSNKAVVNRNPEVQRSADRLSSLNKPYENSTVYKSLFTSTSKVSGTK